MRKHDGRDRAYAESLIKSLASHPLSQPSADSGSCSKSNFSPSASKGSLRTINYNLAVTCSLSVCHYWTESKEALLSRWRISPLTFFRELRARFFVKKAIAFLTKN